MSKKGLFSKLLMPDSSGSCEYFTPFSKSQPVTAAVFAPDNVVLIQKKRLYK